MIPSSTRMWLGSATLVSLLLTSSLTSSASSQPTTATTITRSSMKPALMASSLALSGTYTAAVRNQLPWVSKAVLEITVPAPSASVTEVVQNTQPEKPATALPAKSNTKPIQVAASSQQQISRSDSLALVNNALSLVGVPYVFGGTGRSGFDCSGYTRYVFMGSGISLPRDSYSQFNVGSSVTREKIQAGDLVFFTTYAEGPSHVGIYIGGGNFVHASNTGVRTTSLMDNYYAGRYLGARRVS